MRLYQSYPASYPNESSIFGCNGEENETKDNEFANMKKLLK